MGLLSLLLVVLWTASPRQPAPTVNDLVAQRLLYPASEAAQLLGCHRTTLYDHAKAGRLELVRVGGRTYVRSDELARFVREETSPLRSATRKVG
jgi:excisionase family DNA binding protein